MRGPYLYLHPHAQDLHPEALDESYTAIVTQSQTGSRRDHRYFAYDTFVDGQKATPTDRNLTCQYALPVERSNKAHPPGLSRHQSSYRASRTKPPTSTGHSPITFPTTDVQPMNTKNGSSAIDVTPLTYRAQHLLLLVPSSTDSDLAMDSELLAVRLRQATCQDDDAAQ